MTINSEWELIKKIDALLQTDNTVNNPRLIKGIGDDCAVYIIDDHRYGLFTTDISIENIHFKSSYATAFDIGCKAMTANLSDIAAMGGWPQLALVSLGLPLDCDDQFVLDLYKGFQEVTRPFNVKIVGGDISKSSHLIINIAIYGEVATDELILRAGALIGDGIYVTGDLGSSLAGFKVLTKHPDKEYDYSRLVRKHLCPYPRLDISNDIKKMFNPSAMIDISDGLLSDLNHICEQSNTGFTLIHESLPVSETVNHFAHEYNYDPVFLALTSGEEYQLLFTATIDSKRDEQFQDHAIRIGTITSNGHMLQRNGKCQKIPINGYDHFK